MTAKSSDGPEFNFSDGRSWRRVRRDTILGVLVGLPLIAVIGSAVFAIIIKAGGALLSLLPWSSDPREWVSQSVHEKALKFLAAALELFEAIRASVDETVSIDYVLSLLPSILVSASVVLGVVFLIYHLVLVDALVAEILALHKKITPPNSQR